MGCCQSYRKQDALSMQLSIHTSENASQEFEDLSLTSHTGSAYPPTSASTAALNRSLHGPFKVNLEAAFMLSGVCRSAMSTPRNK